MRVNNETQVLERSGIGDETTFKIDFSSKMAKILSSNLYKDKIRAVIRELSCNAYDSHVAAGCENLPFEIHLPSTFEPWFSVTDFGVGLSHDQIMKLYTTYGSSTKTNSNDYVGALGLGSKSPFAYTSAFDVTSIHNGVSRTYAMFINEQNLPACAFLGETPTSAGNGVQVKIPVNSVDFENFRIKAQNVLVWFKTMPVVKGNSYFRISPISSSFEGKGWKLTDNKGYALARMGCVTYPIDASQVSEFSELVKSPFVIDFGIGELDVAASREELSYDPDTIRVIKLRLKQVSEEITQKFSLEFEKFSTKWGAICHLCSGFISNYEKRHLYYTMEKNGYHPKWRGENIQIIHDGSWNSLFPEEGTPPRIVSAVTPSAKFKDRYGLEQSSNVIFVKNDSSSTNSRVREAMKKNPSNVYYIVSNNINAHSSVVSDETWNKLMEFFGNPPTVNASDLTAAPKKVMNFKACRWASSGYYSSKRKSDNWHKEQEISEDEGGFYVVMDSLDPSYNETKVERFRDIVSLSHELGIISKDLTIWGINKTNTKKIVGDENWKEFMPWIFSAFKKYMEDNKVVEMILAHEEAVLAVSNIESRALNYWKTFFGTMKNSVGDFARSVNTIDQKKNSDISKIKALATFIGIILPRYTESSPTKLEKMVKDFPMMRYALKEGRLENLQDFVKYIEMTEKSVDENRLVA